MKRTRRAAVAIAAALLLGPNLAACDPLNSTCETLTAPRPGGGGGRGGKAGTSKTKPKAKTGNDGSTVTGGGGSTVHRDDDCDED